MNWFKEVFGRIWAAWAILLFTVTMLIFLVPVFLFCLPVPEPKRTHRFIKYARAWMAVFLPGIGCPLIVRGKQHFKKGGPFIVICNHNALMDVPISSPAIPGGNKTIAKAEMAKTPVFGMIYKLGSVLVDRKSEKSRKESFAKMKAVLDMGLHMCIYPEGTRNTSSEPLKPFHDGAFRLALDTRCAIIPGVIFHTRKVNPPDKTFYLMPHPLRIEFLEPIEVTSTDTCETLKQKAFERMKAQIIQGP
ncbi:lysophospholipid acyltransferase family protein [Flavihumibacter sp. CACIAM 22H1]|uniref:lysophospholipid acyltransferase family protein n=1 Tax=Flavihumibacter sp. CACIAM 22H1 TaxID=1812911 RepID=UPI0007A7E66E|nr:lysophospholipid acyltransferase family protein [Flavihumibacter sp. CACIAM 22H1]KYP13109.1 MAG: glycerol acyltransferase [Flavihumibacter sp. CACIAM 22H1]